MGQREEGEAGESGMGWCLELLERGCLLPSRAPDSTPEQGSSLELGLVQFSVLLSALANLWGLPKERRLPSSRQETGSAFVLSPARPRSPTRTHTVPSLAQQAIWRGEGDIKVTFSAGFPWPPYLRKFQLTIYYCCTRFISFIRLITMHN